VAAGVVDEEIYHTKILDARGQAVYRPWQERALDALIVVREPVIHDGQEWGTVEVGIGQASLSQGLMQSVLQDLLVGGLLVVAAAGAGVYASRPVRQSLKELLGFVQKVSAGEARAERLESDLAEVDQVGTLLDDVMARVKEAQGKLAKSQRELKAAQKEMDEYTYVISHDLKEPLRGIEAFSKFLVEDYRDKLDDDGRHHIDVIRNSALRMQRLINDLLKFSRLGQQKNPLQTVGLNAMLMHVRLNLQYALDAKKVDLHVQSLPTVVCDATAMTEVFHNLISNAIKYNDKAHPTVEIGCREQINSETGKPEYLFHVRDNGQGIKPEYFEKIFQLFQRLHRDEEGTGIGLTIVKRVVEWHGGRIWVESTAGQGTTFFFTLPKLASGATSTIVAEAATKGEPQLAKNL
jgi:signal transduction histidine kinase